jgi:threonine/homoserine/homoserine lactone efflux protein
MTDPGFWPLVGFAVAMSITPGPNNAMVAASAANHGIIDTVPHMAGVAVGFTAMIGIVAAGLGGVMIEWPALHLLLQWFFAIWLLLLAWKIATAPPPGSAGKRPPMGFFSAVLFQWVNPKAWAIALSAAGEYMLPDRPLIGEVVRLTAIFAVVALPCLFPWAVLGSSAARILDVPARLRLFNVAMAALLVASVVAMLLE